MKENPIYKAEVETTDAKIEQVKKGYQVLRGTAEKPSLSVVVPVYAGGEAVDNVVDCLLSIIKNKPNFSTEVIAVVNGSQEQLSTTPLVAALEETGIRVVPIAFEPELKKLDKILGARQAGVDAAMADKVIMVDADSKVSPRWIESYYQGLESNTFAYGPVKIEPTGDSIHDATAQISTAAKAVKRRMGIPPMQGGNHGMNKSLLEGIGIDPHTVYSQVRRNEQELAHTHGALFIPDAAIQTPNGFAETGKTGIEFLKLYLGNTISRNARMVIRRAMGQ